MSFMDKTALIKAQFVVVAQNASRHILHLNALPCVSSSTLHDMWTILCPMRIPYQVGSCLNVARGGRKPRSPLSHDVSREQGVKVESH